MFLESCVIHGIVSPRFSIRTLFPCSVSPWTGVPTWVGLTDGAVASETRLTPEFHPRSGDVRRPREIDDVIIVEGHARCFSIWIDPIYVPAARRQ